MSKNYRVTFSLVSPRKAVCMELVPPNSEKMIFLGGVGVLLGSEGVLYSLCTEMPSTAHAQGWLSTPLAREYLCQRCGKALPPLGIEPLPPAPKARALKGRAIWTLVASHRYRGGRCISNIPTSFSFQLFDAEYI